MIEIVWNRLQLKRNEIIPKAFCNGNKSNMETFLNFLPVWNCAENNFEITKFKYFKENNRRVKIDMRNKKVRTRLAYKDEIIRSSN